MSGFKPYPEYKDSGVEWLGEVPEHWVVKPLKFNASCNDTTLPDSTDDDYEIEYVEISDVNELVGITGSTSYKFSDAPSRARRTLRDGDVLVSTVRTYLRAIAPVVNPPKNLIASTGFAVVRPRNGALDGAFLGYMLRAEWWVSEVISRSVGVSYPAINASDLIALDIPIPDVLEQTQIARFLDHETARIDALIAEQQRLIELLKEKRQAVISHAVTKGLDPTVPMKDSGVEWLGEVPAHWEVGGLTRFIGPVVDYRGRTPTKVDEGMFLVTARNIRNGQIDYEASQEYVDPASAESLLGRGWPEVGDLLFTMEAPLGQVALIDRTDIALAQRIVKFRGEPHVMKSHYLMYWFMSTVCQARLETLATGSTALGIKASKLGMIECLAPSLKEQDEIVLYIKRETGKSDTLVSEAEQVILLLQERRSALISAAVTGKIDVRNWQPTGETPEFEHEPMLHAAEQPASYG